MTIQSGSSSQDDIAVPVDSTGREFGLFDLFTSWWRVRVQIFKLALCGAVAAIALFAVAYAILPTHKESATTFRLLFDGLEKGEYPNGTHFSPADIVATPVLAEVYRRNAIEKHVPFDDFKTAWAVIDRNPALDHLERQYAARLEDNRRQMMGMVERVKLEDEYEEKIKGVKNGQFTLVGVLEGPLSGLPDNLTAKVMNDILTVWAERSQARGTFKFDIDSYSQNIVQESVLMQEDYLILVDRLRIMLRRVARNLEALASIPGARLIRVGERQVSLGELQAAVQDSLQFRLALIQGPIFTFGLSKNRSLAENYIDEQLFQLQLKAQELTSKADALPRALASYVSSRSGAGRVEETPASPGAAPSQAYSSGAVIPQVSESFLDRIVNLSTQNADVAFRQELSKEMLEIANRQAELASERQLYEKMKKAIEQADSVVPSTRREETLKNVSQQIDLLISELKDDLQNIQLLHAEISRLQLQPAVIYSIVLPCFTERVAMIRMFPIVIVLGLAWCVFVGLALIILAGRGQPMPGIRS